MAFEWDASKDAANRAKHGIGLDQAAQMDWVRGKTEMDGRSDYGELRWTLYAPISGRWHVCVFTIRNGKFRIVS